MLTCYVHAGSPSFREVLTRTKTVVRGALANADVPYLTVVQDARVPRSSAYNPVFQNMCVLQDAAFFQLPCLDGTSAQAMQVRAPASGIANSPAKAQCSLCRVHRQIT